MNHTYRLIWSQDRQRYIPVPEIARSHGKTSGCKTLACAAIVLGATLVLPSLAQTPPAANALPTGGKVVAGQASIGQTGSQMRIEQSSDKAILNWNRFDIGKNANVQFQQPGSNAVALNRVITGEASQIQGQLSANGQVWLVNPHGIVFGQGSKVDVGGLVASTLGITNQDFLDGKAVFTRHGATGGIVNQGEIQAAEGGLVALLAPTVRNDGIITAQLGTVAMAAGDRVTLQAGANGLLQVQVDSATMRTLVENRQLIVADGGQVVMTGKAADALSSSVVANTGSIQANTLREKDGRILLVSDMRHGETKASGTLQAKFVDTSAATVSIDKNLKVATAGGEWLIDPVDITINSAKATSIQNALGSGNVTVSTANGATNAWGNNGTGNAKGDIHVNANITYTKNKLTLNADNDINLNAVISVNGSGTMALNYGGTAGNKDKTPITNSNLNTSFKNGGGFAGRIDFKKAGTGLLSINGHNYSVIKDANALQNINTTGLAGKYALGGDIDTGSISQFNPIGSGSGSSFSGTFDGLGHIVSNITIHQPNGSYIGLFATITNGSIQNIGVKAVDMLGFTTVGGMAGYNDGGSIRNAYATGSVAAGYSYVGGLVGYNNGIITNAYAIGSAAAGKTYIAANSIAGGYHVGGLVGVNNGTILKAYSVTNTRADRSYVGGLVGSNNGTISNAYATGDVAGDSSIGGLVGVNSGSIHSAYATGSVTGDSNSIGGLVGDGDFGSIRNAYATGSVTVTSGNRFGGLVGSIVLGSWGTHITDAFYATTDASGKAINMGSNNSGTGKTLAQLKQAATFSIWSSDIDDRGGTSATWRIYEGHTTPLLRAFLQPVTVSGGTLASKTYDGTSRGNAGNNYTTSVPGAGLDGRLSYTTNSRNAGTYTTANGSLKLSGLYSDQQGYDISYDNATKLTIDKATLTLKAVTDTKTYNGNIASSKAVQINGLVIGDKIEGLAQSFDSKNAGKRKLQVNSGYTVADGNGGKNYTVKTAQASGTIKKATLTLSATTDTKTYDGTTASSKKVAISGLIKGDKVTELKQSFDSKNAGKRKLQVNSGYTVADGNDGKNYTVKTAKASGTIKKATLTLSATTDTKTYDGTTASSKKVAISGLIKGDKVTELKQSFNSKNAGKRKLQVNSGYTVADGNGGKNYTVKTAKVSGTIKKATLTLSAVSDTKAYDGTTASRQEVNIKGLMNGDDITDLKQAFDSKKIGTRKLKVQGGYTIADGNGGGNYTVKAVNASGNIN